ncbi:MAG TPA: ABC transporter ATP-binding protein [Tissierellales bacterium]|nr:ABC transporter ATP-binding protein [Tissierellales bacterium]
MLNFVGQYFFRILEALGDNKVSKALYSSLIEKDIGFFNNKTTGDLNSLLTNDGREVASWMSVGWLIRLIQIFSLVFTIIMMMRYNVLLTLIILGLIAVSFLTINIIAKKQAEVSENIFSIRGEINQFLIESIQSISLIKPLRKEKYFKDKFKTLIDNKKFKEDKRYSFLLGLYVSMTALLIMILPLVSVGVDAVLASKGKMTVGSILSIYALTGQLQEPVRVLADSFNQERTAMALSNRLKEKVVVENQL